MKKIHILIFALHIFNSHATTNAPEDGVQFICEKVQRTQIKSDMQALLKRNFLASKHINVFEDDDNHKLRFTLNTPDEDTNTLDLIHRPEYWIYDEKLKINTHSKTIPSVSFKEILLSLMQHGRLTQFSGEACTVNALQSHIKLRQNIVAHSEKLNFDWPDGGDAKWNKAYWNRSIPKEKNKLYVALKDAFTFPRKYSLGCYTATKLTYAFTILDYYKKQDKRIFNQVLTIALNDGHPLENVEPPAMWSFEEDFDGTQAGIAGKFLYIKKGVAHRNFVPGDWVYFVNTDASTMHKVGYEGSNSIYLGKGRFVDFYNDAEHSFTFEQKLDEVYQWRNGVFSQSKDFEKVETLSKEKLDLLSRSPADGGVLMDFRAVPYLLGFGGLNNLQ
jgi:hypothetical protein